MSFKIFFKIPKTKGGIKWSKLFLERNHFRCSTRIYFGTSINDLPDGLLPNCKLFADVKSLFSVVHDVARSSPELNSELANISEWAFTWKISFNPDPSKPAEEVIFSSKLKTVPHPSITFNNNPLSLCPAQKHLGLVLDSKLTFNEYINHILSKFNKSIGLLRKFPLVLPWPSLLTIYKTFIRSHFDCANVVYDQCYKSSFHLSRFNTMLLWQ